MLQTDEEAIPAKENAFFAARRQSDRFVDLAFFPREQKSARRLVSWTCHNKGKRRAWRTVDVESSRSKSLCNTLLCEERM